MELNVNRSVLELNIHQKLIYLTTRLLDTNNTPSYDGRPFLCTQRLHGSLSGKHQPASNFDDAVIVSVSQRLHARRVSLYSYEDHWRLLHRHSFAPDQNRKHQCGGHLL